MQFVIEKDYKIDICINNIKLSGTIYEINSDIIVLEIPMTNTEFESISFGRVIAHIYNDKSFYEAEIDILDKMMIERIKYIKITHPVVVKKIQRREYCRVENKEAIIAYSDRVVRDKCIMEDLSGAGMKFSSQNIYEVGDFVIFEIPVTNNKVNVKGKIVRMQKNSIKNFSYGVSFDNINEDIKEKIINKVFNKMRKELNERYKEKVTS